MPKKHQYSDEELIRRFQEGDEYAYLELVNRYRDRLMNFTYRFLGNEEDAEDIVQDTFVKLYTHKHFYRNIAKFSTWIYTIAANLAKTELRKRKRRKVSYLSQMGTDERILIYPRKIKPTTTVKAGLPKDTFRMQYRNFLFISGLRSFCEIFRNFLMRRLVIYSMFH